MTPLDAAASDPRHGGASFPLRHRLIRLGWAVVWRGFGVWTPTPLFAWRRFLLRTFGAKIAATAKVYPGVQVWYPANLEMAEWSCLGPQVNCYSMATIRLGAHALVSQGAHLCAGTHDVDDPHFQLLTNPIEIGERAWIAAEAFVGPGVVVEPGAVLGARGVSFKHIPAWSIQAGNPARHVRMRRHD